jgi:hypothetical protein
MVDHCALQSLPTFKDIVVMIAKHSDQPCVTGKKTKQKAKKAYRERNGVRNETI